MLPYMIRFVVRRAVTLAVNTVLITLLARVARKSPRGNRTDSSHKVPQ